MKAEPIPATPPGQGRQPTEKTAEDIADMVRAAATVSEMFAAALKSIDPDLSFTHWNLLSLLRSEGPMRPFQAAARLRVSRQLVFQTAKKLGRLDYVFFSSEEDRRAVTITLSPKAEAMLDRMDESLASIALGLNERAPGAALRPLRNVLAFIANGLFTPDSDG